MRVPTRSPRWLPLFLLVTFLVSFSLDLRAQTPPPIPSGDIRIHYFRPDGNYLGWTVYAFGDTTEPNNFNAGPVAVSGQDSFGAYFDVGVTSGAQNVGLIIHNGDVKDPGPNEYVNPSTQGNEFWQLSGSDILQTTQPPTIQQQDPAIPAGHVRIHYYRPDNNYANWELYPFGATSDGTGNFCGTDDFVSGYDTFGAYYDVGVNPGLNGGQLGFILHNCATNVKDPGPNMYLQVTSNSEAWILSGDATVYLSRPVTEYAQDPPIPANTARIHYYRPDSNYASWTVYAFENTTDDTNNYNGGPVFVTGYDSYGAFFDVGLTANAQQIGFIIHNISTGVKDPGPNMYLNIDPATNTAQAWVVSGDAQVFPTQPTSAQLLNGVFLQEQSYWIDRTTVAIQGQYFQSGWKYYLSSDPNANLQLTSTGVTGGTGATQIPLSAYSGGLTASELAAFPMLANGYAVLHLPANTDSKLLQQALQGELAVWAVGPDGALRYATGVQDPGVLDDLFYYPGPLGVIFNDGANSQTSTTTVQNNSAPILIQVWAPTAQFVKLQLFTNPTDTTPAQVVPMTESNGVWSAPLDENCKGMYYLYDLRVYAPSQHAMVENFVTDPYSIDLALNGVKSRITDLQSPDTMPPGWQGDHAPVLTSVNDISIYELHVRDFSVDDPTVPAQHQGTYLAFSDLQSNGMQHLRQLAQAGLKAVHILPTFHFASVNEDKSTWQTPGNLSGYPPDGTQQQAAVTNVQNVDAYNWGYDPVHYFAPEGAYDLDPYQRVSEYRQMVMGLHRAGLRMIQDVVFNHTSSAGENPNSVLDEVVPGYYQRLDANGVQETGSCCNDTAPEHKMMGKLITDAVVLNAKQYHVDGFRFDLMSFLFVSNMVQIQQALANLTVEKDGIDGSKIYLYGEGFDFGEVANDALGVNASQQNLYGYGIGTFNDRIRDGIRGGSPFTDERVQGFATGLFTDPSSYTNQNQVSTDQQNALLQEADWVRLGLAGNLRNFSFVDYQGNVVTGAQVNYFGQPAGYTASPIEDINYCSVHDNQALFDAVQLKSAASDDMATRTRRQVLAMSVIALGQGVPFFLGGDDLLRSKDMDANSYNSGDWFNKIDFTFQTNNWGIGLPIASQNQSNWPIMQPLLANPALKATPQNIQSATQAYQEFLRIRYSSGLFRMQTFNEVQNNLHFLNTGSQQVPGVIVMKLDANGGNYGPFSSVVVIINAQNQPINFQSDALKGLNLRLHPVQQMSSDPVVREARFNSQTGTASVPGLTTAVFVTSGSTAM